MCPCVMGMLEPPIEGATFVGKWTNFVCGGWDYLLRISCEERRCWCGCRGLMQLLSSLHPK